MTRQIGTLESHIQQAGAESQEAEAEYERWLSDDLDDNTTLILNISRTLIAFN